MVREVGSDAKVDRLPIPEVHRRTIDALGSAMRVAETDGIEQVVILGQLPDGFLFVSAGDGEPLSAAQCLWLIEYGRQHLVTGRCFERDRG